ncbi:uncharacterized protein LOC121374921 [Gigantopelta aegis]|uniref:uncharacterized protein LOC121374921 n=1 Tax=Gigantopelta aegis TaxID=1735272 RepID=UPI001B88C709|nr:uncharacterized protein LOC121374921 [Gigantopelta aegis]
MHIHLNCSKLFCLKKAAALDVWTKPILPKGSLAVAVVNGNNKGVPRKAVIQLKELGLTNPSGYNVTETFDGTALGLFRPLDKLTVEANPSGIYLFTAVPINTGAKTIIV